MFDPTTGVPRALSRYLDPLIGKVYGDDRRLRPCQEVDRRQAKLVHNAPQYRLQDYLGYAWFVVGAGLAVLTVLSAAVMSSILGTAAFSRFALWSGPVLIGLMTTALSLSLIESIKMDILSYRARRSKKLPARTFLRYADPVDFWLALVIGVLAALLVLQGLSQ